jgi:tRNA A-37 threonylcarbamoyl transferase component Bud32
VSSRPPLSPGDVVHGRYTVLRLLGKGAFGATYLVRDDERFGASCALKELQPQDESLDWKARELFEREARILAAIKHPRVPALHAYFIENERYYLVQALVEGSALDTALKESGPLTENEVRGIVVDALEVLKYLHHRDPPVVHRDIKPSNLIRDTEGRIHVIDFGAVREALAAVPANSNATMIGTPGYAPLEQAMGHPVPSSDLHALGMTALHLLSDRGPSHWRDPITAEPSIIGRTSASPQFERFLARMVADIPERFSTAAEASAELLGGETVIEASTVTPLSTTGRSPKPASKASAAATVIESAPATPSAPAPRRSGSLKRAAAAGVIVVAIGGIGYWGATRGKDNKATDSAAAPAAQAEQLDNESSMRTRFGADLVVRHPGSWRLASAATDGYIALQDPRTTGIFLTAMDTSSDAPAQFARQWAVNVTRKFGGVELADEGKQDVAGGFWRFALQVRRSTVAEKGVLVVEVPPGARTPAIYRWWALLGESDANTSTALAMANSLTTRQAAR